MRHYTRAEMEQVYNHVVGERLPGRGPQGIHEVSTVQRYAIGARRQIGNRAFHYARAGGLVVPDMAVMNRGAQDVAFRAIGAVALAGATSIVITVANPDGPAADGSLPLNYLVGGYVVVFKLGVNRAFTRGITSSTVIAAGGGLVTIGLDAPIPEALAITDNAEAIASPYRNVVDGSLVIWTRYATVAGIATVPGVLDDFLWLQTWGPAWLAPHSAQFAGTDNFSVYFNEDGSISDGDEAPPTFLAQYAGYILAVDPSLACGAPFFMLQLDP